MTTIRKSRPSSSTADKILLVGGDPRANELRATVLRSQGAQVDTAADPSEARSLWRPGVYALMLIDVRRHLPGEVLDVCRHIRDFYPKQRIAFIVGPPRYLSTTWPEEVFEPSQRPAQWEETIHALAAAA